MGRTSFLSFEDGWETDQLGLSTQMPARVHFAFNKAKSYTVEDKTLKVLISPPKTKITAENKRYLQILDLLEIFGKAPIEVEDPFRFMSDLIEKLGKAR